MPKQKLSYADLLEIDKHCNACIEYLSNTGVSGENLHLNKCLALVFFGIKVKVAGKLAGVVPGKGCSLKLTDIQMQAIYHVRNERHVSSAETDNGIVRLLTLNTK
ncbi:MAG: hypothetical protein LCH37_13080 [Bacteroidetes bacterium]|nr:hypothetical protein [Bacteroidota bacterium]